MRSCAITGLDPELASTFRVKAVGQLGDEYSAASAAIFPTEPGVPGTPGGRSDRSGYRDGDLDGADDRWSGGELCVDRQ